MRRWQVPSTERERLPRRRSDAELLEQIYARGGRYRRRRRRLAGAAGMVTAILAIVVAGTIVTRLPGGGAPQDVAARGVAAPASPGSSTPTAVEPLELPPEVSITTVPPEPLPTPTVSRSGASTAAPATPTTAAPVPPPAEPEVGSTATGEAAPPQTVKAAGAAVSSATSVPAEEPPACLNSTDPACGPFRWEPEPDPNAPLTVTVRATPRPGDPRTFDFAIVYSDPDAPIREGCRMNDYGDGGTIAASSCAVTACVATYGPWTPPAKEPGYAEAQASHTFAAPGTYVVRFSASSGNMCGHPYASTGTGSTEVVVPAS